MSKVATKVGAKGAGLAVRKLPAPMARRAAQAVATRASNATSKVLARAVDRLPIQRSVDVAVPLQVAWDEWMELESLPEGAYTIEEVERDGDGRLLGRRGRRDWEGEIVEERTDESFAWRSIHGSDVAGLVTFHALGERLTRVELNLDVVPEGVGEAVSLLVHAADRRAEADLRRFKARVEAIDPDDYSQLDEEDEE
jgi:uncharacterized membrane protein